jgi:hypothetical protein
LASELSGGDGKKTGAGKRRAEKQQGLISHLDSAKKWRSWAFCVSHDTRPEFLVSGTHFVADQLPIQ